MAQMTIVGAGVSGLVAAIEAAERGWSVTLLESAAAPGGRARTLAGPYHANLGPHAVYVDGSLWSWLEGRELAPPVIGPPSGSVRRGATLVLIGGRLGGWPPELTVGVEALPEEAPADTSFRSWLIRYLSPEVAEAIVGLLFVATYDHDPGRLSAAFVHETLRRSRRSTAGVVRFVVGGFERLVDRLVERATQLGVEVRTSTVVEKVRKGPTLVATRLESARLITGDASLVWPGTTVALLDLGLETQPGIDWFRVFDVDGRTYLNRLNELDRSLAPLGHDLVQAAAPCRPGEGPESALRRTEEVLDIAWPGWRSRVRWRRRALMRGMTGAVDLPGTTWRDRPAIHRGGGLYVATDQSAAPGLFTEVGVAAALQAVADMSGTGAVSGRNATVV
jgi:hypothetical protein